MWRCEKVVILLTDGAAVQFHFGFNSVEVYDKTYLEIQMMQEILKQFLRSDSEV